jgi:thioredoxin
MKKIAIKLFLSALFLFFGFTTNAQTEKKPEMLTKETFIKKVWDYKTNPNEYKYLGDKPCIIDFYADWCRPCRMIAPFLDEFCKTYDGKIYVYKVNTDQQKELQALFNASSIPMVIFFPMKGKPTATKGALPKEQYEQLIKELLLPSITQPNKKNKQ